MRVAKMNAGLDAGPIQKICGAGSVRYPDFGAILTSLLPTGIYYLLILDLG